MTSDATQLRDATLHHVAGSDAQDVPPGYKRTEVGVIPIDWDVASLARIAATATGNTPPTADKANYGDEYLFVSPADLGETKYVATTQKKLSRSGFARSRSFPRDSILFVSIGSTIGKCAIASVELATNQQINAVFPSPSFSVDYLYYTICAAAPRIRAQAGEQAVPIVNKTQFSATIVPLAQLPEQRAIAEALSDVDGLLGALEALIAKKRAIKQAAMQQLLTGNTRLPGFSREWEASRLHEFVRDFIVPMRDKPKRFAGDVPWCRIEDCDGIYLGESKSARYVDAQTIGEMNLKVFPVGTLLVSCSADLGHCAIVAKPLVSNQTFIGLVFDATVASNLFFYYYMSFRAKDLNISSSGTTISYLSREQFEEFPVVVPPDQKEQTAIAAVLSDMDAEIAALESRRDKTRAIKQGMMQHLLTGRVRLVRPEAAA